MTPLIDGKMNARKIDHDTSAKNHIPALDGLRGLAILLVLAYHIVDRFQSKSAELTGHSVVTGIRNLAFGGWTGVDLFFVLSGFLITGILWDTRDAAHYFRNFYVRRTLRIFPLYYAALIFMLFIVPAAGAAFVPYIPWQFHELIQVDLVNGLIYARSFWPYFFTYLTSVLVAWKGFAFWMSHLWSLSVEEHFYLIWPFVVHRLKLRTLIITSAALVGGALLCRALALPLRTYNAIYALIPFRMDGLALGALLALLWRTPEHKPQVRYWARMVMPVAGSILFAILIFKGKGSTIGNVSQTIGYTASILFYGSLLVRVLDTEWLNLIFRHRSLRIFGKYSYSIYIFHVLPLFLASPLFALGDPFHGSIVVRALKFLSVSQAKPISGPLLWLDGIFYILFVPAASAGIAMITWRLIEAPCLRLKRFFLYEEPGRSVEGANIVTDLVRG